MSKKNEKRLCWNCDGSVSFHLTHCPYCGVDLAHAAKGVTAPLFEPTNPYQPPSSLHNDIPKPPYANLFAQTEAPVSEAEWRRALQDQSGEGEKEESEARDLPSSVTWLLLLPGLFFLLFGLALVFFSSEGVLTLRWNQSFAYFYFLSALPLLYLGWRALR